MKNLSLKVKLVGSFVIVNLIIVVGSYVGNSGISKAVQLSDNISLYETTVKVLLQKKVDHLQWVRKAGEFQSDESITQLAVEKDPQKCSLGKWYYGEERKKAEASIPELAPLLRQLEEPHTKLHESAKELDRILAKGKDHRQEAQKYYKSEMSSYLNNVQKILDEIAQLSDRGLSEAKRSSEGQLDHFKILAVMGSILGTVVAVGLGILLTISITKPLKRVLEGLSAGSEQVSSGSNQVASASQSLAEGSTEQAASLEETSASMEEMASMTKQNSENAHQAKSMMAQAHQVVDNVNNHMQEMGTAIEKITKSSEETSKIIKTIDEIAFQTNLLALNAAVEAARAGEAGAGFAVVADEVRNLALRAAEAAKNTNDLIESTIKAIQHGSKLTLSTKEAFKQNVEISGKIGKLVDEIAAASQEQAQGISQVNKAVAEMDKVVQQNAANAQESASASSQMSAQAEQLKNYVKELNVLIHGQENGKEAKGRSLPPRGGQGVRKVRSSSSTPKPFLAQFKKGKGTKEAFSPARALKPEEVIPFNDTDFKEF